MQVIVKSFDQGRALAHVEGLVEDPTSLLESAGSFMVGRFQQAFWDQGRPPGSWAPRHVPNVGGIIMDFSEGRDEPQPNRFEDSPVLRDRGTLQATLDHRVTGRTTVEAGSDQDYAGTQHFGGESETDEITDDMQTRMAKWLDTQDIEMQEELGWLIHHFQKGRSVTIRVQARPFAELNEQDLDDLEKLLALEIVSDVD